IPSVRARTEPCAFCGVNDHRVNCIPVHAINSLCVLSRANLTPMTDAPAPLSRPVLAGIVTALVGFTSSFAVVLTGLHSVGATPAQAASGLLVLSITMGV